MNRHWLIIGLQLLMKRLLAAWLLVNYDFCLPKNDTPTTNHRHRTRCIVDTFCSRFPSIQYNWLNLRCTSRRCHTQFDCIIYDMPEVQFTGSGYYQSEEEKKTSFIIQTSHAVYSCQETNIVFRRLVRPQSTNSKVAINV